MGDSVSTEAAPPITLGNYSQELLELLDHLKVKQAAIAGYSMGAHIAMDLAKRAPERVSKVILIGELPLLQPLELVAQLYFPLRIDEWTTKDNETTMKEHINSLGKLQERLGCKKGAVGFCETIVKETSKAPLHVLQQSLMSLIDAPPPTEKLAQPVHFIFGKDTAAPGGTTSRDLHGEEGDNWPHWARSALVSREITAFLEPEEFDERDHHHAR